MKPISDEAMVLSAVDYGDADRLISLFTFHHGRISAFAPGARKSRKRFGGALEPGSHVIAHWVERRGEVVRLEKVDLQNSFFHIREDLNRIARSAYCLELCRELVREREPHGPLFRQLVSYFSLLDSALVGPTSLLAFELSALELAGLKPVFSACVICGDDIGENPRFDPGHGGALCGSCSSRSPFGVRVSRDLMRSLDSIQMGQKEKLDSRSRAQARDLLNVFIEHHLGRKLKSVSFMSDLDVD